MRHDADCPFCAIARAAPGETLVVAESAHWLAFFPDHPASPGHTLLIPRVHVQDLWQVDDDELLAGLASAVRSVGRAVRRAVDAPGMNLITSAGMAAEQTVPHLHLHLLPRWPDDGIGIWPDQERDQPADLASIAAAIRVELPEHLRAAS